MGFFNDLFNWENEVDEEELTLGRFSDAYKPTASYKIWENSILAFEADEFLKSAALFFEFLKNPNQENISFKSDDDQINFEFFQGSKIVKGYINTHKFRAEAKVAKAKDLNIGLLRRLLDNNYLLKYSRYALDKEDNIVMLFDSYTIDASPNKLYQGLKEMAIQADKLDDMIISEFDGLEPINNSHIIERSEVVKEKQYEYLITQLSNCFNEIENGKLNIDQFPGGLSYLLLAANYKLDFLLKPEGFLMDIIEKNHRIFFANDGKEIGLKNKLFINSFREIQKRKKEEIKEELYDVISTFGLPTPSSHENIVNFINSELPNLNWYKENNHKAIALAIPSYIVGYCLFNYAMPLPTMKLFKLFYKITEPTFFYKEGEKSKFLTNDQPNKSAIKKEIDLIINTYDGVYPKLKINHNQINYKDIISFSESFLAMVKSLDLNQ